MSGTEATRFFDTSGCLNLTRPTSGTPTAATRQRKRPVSSSIPTRGQLKLDLYNFDHIDNAHSKYVLTSPRSLEACARLNIKPTTLLPKRLADIQDDIGSEKVRLATLADVRDQMEMERLDKLQRCREEREKIIREEALATNASSRVMIEPQPSYVHDSSMPRRSYVATKFNPSSSLLNGLEQPTTIKSVPIRSQSTTSVKFSDYNTNTNLPPRSTSSIRLTTTYPNSKSATIEQENYDDRYDVRPPSSIGFADDVQRLNKTFQRLSTSDYGPKHSKHDQYMNSLENVKEMIERRTAHTTTDVDPENLAFEKKQYEILLGHYDHELKLQKTRENARRIEKGKEIERYQTLIQDIEEQTKAEDRRRNELLRKKSKLHHTRETYETIQARNYEQKLADLKRRHLELLNEIRRKERRTKNFIQDKQEAVNLSRTLAKSTQDLREYIRDTHENFDDRAKKAELTSSILIKKPKSSSNRNHLHSSIRA